MYDIILHTVGRCREVGPESRSRKGEYIATIQNSTLGLRCLTYLLWLKADVNGRLQLGPKIIKLSMLNSADYKI